MCGGDRRPNPHPVAHMAPDNCREGAAVGRRSLSEKSSSAVTGGGEWRSVREGGNATGGLPTVSV